MKKLIFGFLLLSLMACQKTIIYDLPVEESQLVVSTKIFALDSVVAIVSISVPSLSSQKPGYSKSAKVLLLEEGTMVSELSLVEAGDINYYISQYQCKPGFNYTIKVSQSGYDSVEGSVTVPKSAPVLSNLTLSNRNEMEDITVTLSDKGNEENIYRIELICGEQNIFNFENGFYSDDLTIEFYDGYSDLFDGDADGNYGIRGYLRDRFFNGGDKKIKISTYAGSTSNGCKLIISSITQETYEFERSINVTLGSDNGPFSEPISIISNMSNGKGAITAQYVTSISVP